MQLLCNKGPLGNYVYSLQLNAYMYESNCKIQGIWDTPIIGIGENIHGYLAGGAVTSVYN